jgi:EF hand domain-containing protein
MSFDILGSASRNAPGWPRVAVFFLALFMPALAAAPAWAVDERGQPLPRNWQLAQRLGARIERIEVVQMLEAILRGSQMGPGDGWFRPSQTRYDRYWLAAHCDKNHDRQLTPEEFSGPRALFERLDRDRDGAVTAEDLDWTDQSAYLRLIAAAGRPFSILDANSNGRVSREEWNAFFTRMARGRDQITPEDFQRALVAPPQQRPKPGEPPPPDAGPPTMLTLLDGLAKGELGSWLEGPAIDGDAPLFVLDRQNGKGKVALEDFRGKKPVVLIFGSFT